MTLAEPERWPLQRHRVKFQIITHNAGDSAIVSQILTADDSPETPVRPHTNVVSGRRAGG